MSADDPQHILIVDDHPVVRRGFRQLLDEQSDLVPAWEAGTPGEVMDVMADHTPDLVLMDVTLDAGISGIDLIKQIQATQPEVPVLAISMHDEKLYAARALTAGARGYVMKRVPDEELVRAVRCVLDGGVYVSETVKEKLSEPVDGEEANGSLLGQLSDRELEVFLLLGQGFAPRHIAEKLSVSVKTVGTHRRNLKQKLNLDSSSELTRYAIAWRREHSPE